MPQMHIHCSLQLHKWCWEIKLLKVKYNEYTTMEWYFKYETSHCLNDWVVGSLTAKLKMLSCPKNETKYMLLEKRGDCCQALPHTYKQKNIQPWVTARKKKTKGKGRRKRVGILSYLT